MPRDSSVYLGGDVKRVVYILPAPDLLNKLVAKPHKKIWPHLVLILAFPLARLYHCKLAATKDYHVLMAFIV